MVRVNKKWRFVSVGMCFFASSLAYGAIVNTVTVTGKGIGVDNVIIDVSATATESVDVVDAASSLIIVKSAEITTGNSDAIADVGEEITYTFTVTNDGNTTVAGVGVEETEFNGTGGTVVPTNPLIVTDPAPSGNSYDTTNTTDNLWESLAPGDSVKFTATYTVKQSDLDTITN